MKKFFCVLIAVLLLAGCTQNSEPVQTTAVPTETTPLTLTEAITTEAVYEPALQKIELAVYDPFSDSVKVKDSVYNELTEAVQEVSDALLLVAGHPFNLRNSRWQGIIADQSVKLEENEEMDYCFNPLNTDFAADEDELFAYFRQIFTENYMSDEKIRTCLFGLDEYDGQPSYKTIDGLLCVKNKYMGVPYHVYTEGMTVLSYSDDRAEIRADAYGVDYPYSHYVLSLVKSDNGWRLDGLEDKGGYYIREAQLLYNAITLKEDRLNAILGGGNVPENADIVNIDGEEYVQTDTGMSLSEMREFFANTFRETVYVYNEYSFEPLDGESLRDAYTEKYIDGVYAERDGILYRKADAPRRYLPKLELSPYDAGAGGGGAGSEDYLRCERSFLDERTGETVRSDVTLTYKAEDYTDDALYYFLYIASKLPIKEISE